MANAEDDLSGAGHFQPFLDRVIKTYASDAYRDELLRAKAEYFRQTGEVHEDDQHFFELRMASFFDWYLFERPMDGWTLSPVQRYLADHQYVLSPDEQAVYQGLGEQVHSLFIFKRKKWRSKLLILKDLLANTKRYVMERREWSALESGDLFEARLVPFKGELFFSKGFCFYPRGANRYIIKEAKKSRKGIGDDPKELMRKLQYLRYLEERFKHVDVRRIYSEDGVGLIPAGSQKPAP